jgi:RecA/RadA recombinase
MVELKKKSKNRKLLEAKVNEHKKKDTVGDSDVQADDKKPIEKAHFISSGSSYLNLCLTDHIKCGFKFGTIVNIIGDSKAGKSMLALTCLAEAVNDPRVADYDLIYKDAENACDFDIPYLFGRKFMDRVIMDDEKIVVVEQFGSSVYKRLEKKKPFIIVLDSLDSLSSIADQKKKAEDAKKVAKGKEPDGSYGDGKAKWLSGFFRQYVDDISSNRSIIVVISQTRDNIGFGAQFKPKIRSGGNALEFYSKHELWLAYKKQLKSKDLPIGGDVQAKVTKNKVTGKRRDAYFSIYYDYGIDDITSMIQFLVDVKYWGTAGQKIVADEFGETCTMKKLVKEIESSDRNIQRLKRLSQKAWTQREESVRLSHRRRRFE